ncbi:MAG: hypothetical protein SOZ00_02065 [Tidjanibacter sp.]|nr:hypothetical protein [Tidjanibacter sp.]
MELNRLISVTLATVVALFAPIDMLNAQQSEPEIVTTFGTEHIASTFFIERYLNNDLVHWLDNMDENVTYEAETTGRFNSPDPLIFSINGNSYRQNRYYLDGMRIDSRSAAGSTLYVPNMYRTALSIDGISSGVGFTSDRGSLHRSAEVTYNMGGLGGISAGTAEMIHWFHRTASDRLYKPIDFRNKTAGALTALVELPVGGEQQQLYLDLGRRYQVGFDQWGISSFYPEDYATAQLSGSLFSGRTTGLFDSAHYILNLRHRTKAGTEYYMAEQESARQQNAFATLYVTRERGSSRLTTGFSAALENKRHNELCFSRNLIDQDGEAFEPWYPDGVTAEFSHSLTYSRPLNEWLRLEADCFNSLMGFTPTTQNFYNAVYADRTDAAHTYNSLYLYEWQSSAFWSGLLENTLSLKAERALSAQTSLRADFDLTLDGMVLAGKSMIRPGWQVQTGVDYRPNSWFRMEVNLARKRISYTINDIEFFSDDYLNGSVYYWNDKDGNRAFDNGERGVLHTTTGGSCHRAAENLKQQSYWVFDLPFSFRFGHHEIAVQNSLRKYTNIWVTQYDAAAETYGTTKTIGDQEIYFLGDGRVDYRVVNFPTSMMTTQSPLNFFTNSPFWFSNTVRYTYTSPKLLLSLSWQSYGMAGISALGSGPLHNNIGVLSESTANPNHSYKRVGRVDQDRAYIARILCSYRPTERLSITMTGKFKDGQPFTNYSTSIATDSEGNNNIAIWTDNTKGINPFDGDFGCRKDAFFNIDLRVAYRFKLRSLPCTIEASGYNLYDFGTELTEYTFNPEGAGPRRAMSLNIPRGAMLTLRIGM